MKNFEKHIQKLGDMVHAYNLSILQVETKELHQKSQGYNEAMSQEMKGRKDGKEEGRKDGEREG